MRWTKVSIQLQGEKLSETIYEKSEEGIAKITINRPERRNAFTPRTILELISCLEDAKEDKRVAAVILTGKGTSAFCSGGDQAVRDVGGYVGKDGVPRLNFLDLQVRLCLHHLFCFQFLYSNSPSFSHSLAHSIVLSYFFFC